MKEMQECGANYVAKNSEDDEKDTCCEEVGVVAKAGGRPRWRQNGSVNENLERNSMRITSVQMKCFWTK